MISALILTLNEEANLADCLASLPWRDDVHVLDSGSTDRTLGIAAEMGAKVTVRPFDDYASQRNAGLNLPFEHEWIVMLDADERMTPDLAREIEARIAEATPQQAIFRVRRRDIFMGRWLKRSSGYPTWFPRVMRRGRVRVERAINETYAADGEVRHLAGHLDHHPFNKGVDWWFDRHNRYSAAEAALLATPSSQHRGSRKALFSSDATERRAAHKALAYQLPARPFLVFLYLYILRGGFLDGKAGYHFACMRLAYEVMIDAKLAVSNGLTILPAAEARRMTAPPDCSRSSS